MPVSFVSAKKITSQRFSGRGNLVSEITDLSPEEIDLLVYA